MVSVTVDDKGIEESYAIRNRRGDTLENSYGIVRYALLSLNIDHISTLPMIRHPEQMQTLPVLDPDIAHVESVGIRTATTERLIQTGMKSNIIDRPSSIHPHTVTRRHNCADTFK